MNEPKPEENKMENVEGPLTRESVIESLRQDPKNVELLISYVEMRQKQIQAPYVSREDTEKMTFALNLELADLYRDAGLRGQAWDAYEEAFDLAEAQGMEDECRKINQELNKLNEWKE